MGSAIEPAPTRNEPATTGPRRRSISLPTARYSRTVLPQLVAALALATADIERELAV